MSFTPAKIITSAQQGPHEKLEQTVRRHFSHSSQKPIAEHNQEAFDTARQYWQQQGQPKTLLDSGCGTGESSRYLATTHPDCLVIGIDQSLKRLSNTQNQTLPTNCLLIRAECTDFWRLAEAAQWQFSQHSLFYPNPYPKPKHLQRRWHGDAHWTHLLAISQSIVMRTNWHIYAQEFYEALCLSQNFISQTPLLAQRGGVEHGAARNVTAQPGTAQRHPQLLHHAQVQHLAQHTIALNPFIPSSSITAFERKYHASGHTLWEVTSQ